MAKLALIPVLFVIACLFAGFYGALHDQISCSVSTEYYSQFKFDQFRIDDSIRNRVGVAIVGWLASWWMGLVIGIFLIPAGLPIRGTSQYFWCMIRVFAVVVVTTMVVGLAALFYAFIAIDVTTVEETQRYGKIKSSTKLRLLAREQCIISAIWAGCSE